MNVMKSTLPKPVRSACSCLTLLYLLLLDGPLLAGWTSGKNAVSVLGQSDFASDLANQGGANPSAGSLNNPQSVAVDPVTGKLFVCDSSNQRVLRFSSAAALETGADAEAVFGQDDFTSATAGPEANHFSSPVGITIDADGRLWVADNINNRVLMFEDASSRSSGASADGLLGAAGFVTNPSGTGQGQMRQPQDVAVDRNGTLWVADWQNNRVLRFDNAAEKAAANAADQGNHLGLADGVLGQADFGSDEINRGAGINAPVGNGMDRPWRLAVDASDGLWVCDAFNNRVLYFANAATKTNGSGADGLIGSKDFVTETSSGAGQTRFWGPRGIAIDSRGDLWVTEEFNRRVVRIPGAAEAALANAGNTSQNTALPDVVLGQPDFDSNGIPTPATAALMTSGWGVCASPYGHLWAVDFRDHRVLRFTPDTDSYRGDGLVGLKKSSLKGNNRYNSSGSGQSVTGKSANLKKLKFYLRQENDGDYGDDLRLTGTKKNRYFKIDYYRKTGGRQKITGQVTGAGYLDITLPSGSKTDFEIEVKPQRAASGRSKTRKIKVTSSSLLGGLTDRVKATAKTLK